MMTLETLPMAVAFILAGGFALALLVRCVRRDLRRVLWTAAQDAPADPMARWEVASLLVMVSVVVAYGLAS